MQTGASSSPLPLPSMLPWRMCSEQEAHDRVMFKELSILECTTATSHRHIHPKDRIPDPHRCIKKYRRSAAGGGVQSYSHASTSGEDGDGQSNSRSLEDLEMTVKYLISQIYAHQRSCPEMNMNQPVSLVDAVNFVDDRIRAVQVDLTTLLGMRSDSHRDNNISNSHGNSMNVSPSPWRTVRKIQAQLIRYNLLTQHLLSVSSQQKYQWKFAHTALTTAISSFFASLDSERAEGGRGEDEEDDDDEEIDEIMSYAALLHLVTIIKAREVAVPESSEASSSSSSGSGTRRCGLALDGGEGISAILGLYRKYAPLSGDVNKVEEKKERLSGSSSLYQSTSTTASALPKYQWALRLASSVDQGDFLAVLRMIAPIEAEGGGKSEKYTETDTADTNNMKSSNEKLKRWRIMTRLILAQVVPLIRIGLMRLYNKGFMKQEKVKDTDLAKLLHFSSSKEAITFCQNIGLPTLSSSSLSTNSDSNGNGNGNSDSNIHDRVVMKAAPISITGNANISLMANPGRSMDEFVFGDQAWLHLQLKQEIECASEKNKKFAKEQKGKNTNIRNTPLKKKASPSPLAAKVKVKVKKVAPVPVDPYEGMSSLQIAMMKMKIKEEQTSGSSDPNEIDLDEDDDEDDGPPSDPNEIDLDESDHQEEDWETKEDDDWEVDMDEVSTTISSGSRVDEDGVLIFPPSILCNLIM